MQRHRRGYTLIELTLVVGIIVIFGTVTFISLSGRRATNELQSTAQQMASLLREAQARAMNQASNTLWGVHFNNAASGPFYALYYTTYQTSTRVSFHRLPLSVIYVTSSLAQGASSSIAFATLSGQTLASRSIRIAAISNQTASATISVASSGAVSY